MGAAAKFFMLLTAPSPLLRPRSSLLRLSRHPALSSLRRHHHHHLASSPLASNQSLVGIGFSIKASRRLHSYPAALSDDRFADPSPSGVPWQEWSRFFECLASAGYSDFRRFPVPDGIVFACVGDLPEDFTQVVWSCLAFAHNRPDLLGYISRKDIEVVIANCAPFLFEDSADITWRMRSFLSSGGSHISRGVLESDKAYTVDLMKFLVSYISNPTKSMENTVAENKGLVESSVRNILSELAQVIPVVSKPGRYGQSVEMKKGDWICPRCEFMNFARNVKCLECDEARPPRQLTGGEWECPQCDFFNYGRNMVCLRCDCQRPGQISLGSSSGLKNGNESHPNDEKAERWFDKVSSLDNSSQFNSAAVYEDFPEIMPLRKGVNNYAVSTRMTPLERRSAANVQYEKNCVNERGMLEGNAALDENKNLDKTVGKRLDEILGRTYPAPNTDNKSISAARTKASPPQPGNPKRDNSGYVPFVPLPADMFAKKSQESKAPESGNVGTNNYESVPSKADKQGPVSRSEFGNSRDSAESLNKDEQSEKSERWLNRVAELHDVTDIANAIPDGNFPEIMPERKGENRFVISNKKEQSLGSPPYQRRADTGQESKNSYVPFVPFPPDYFAKKDKLPVDGIDSSQTASCENSSKFAPESPRGNMEYASPPAPNASYGDGVQWRETQRTSMGSKNWESPGQRINERNLDQSSSNPHIHGMGNFGYSGRENASGTSNITGSSDGSMNNETVRASWTGKSLEGSAVKEPDPLDMSEEAKAERFFRRAAQIKDISELSQIPDEDFPSIMPMRKGVNRFVVSKRKTPMERRLTSAQYRRNLPVVSSDSVNKENKDG